MTVLRKHLTLPSNQVMNTSIGVETHYTQAFIMLVVEYSNKNIFPPVTKLTTCNTIMQHFKSSGLSHFC